MKQELDRLPSITDEDAPHLSFSFAGFCFWVGNAKVTADDRGKRRSLGRSLAQITAGGGR